jgi:hypothetical protein
MFRMGAVPSAMPHPADNPPSPVIDRAQAEAPASIRLAPISVPDLAALPKREKLWQDDDGVDYELEKPAEVPAEFPIGQTSKPLGAKLWERGGVAEASLIALRKISDYAYLISLPFLLLMLTAIIFQKRELAIAAGVAVVLLTLVRLVLDGFVLVTLAFKNGPVEGVLFFIPPLTFYYLSKRGKVMRNALGRFLGGAVPILAVLLLALFVPWLRGGTEGESKAVKADRLRSEIQDVRAQIKTRIETPSDPAN